MEGVCSMEDDIEYLIKSRHSVRSFYDKPIEEHAKEELQALFYLDPLDHMFPTFIR